MTLFNTVETIIVSSISGLVAFIPNLIGGLILIAIGLILAQIVRHLLYSLFSFFRLGELLKRAKMGTQREVRIWEEIVTEIIRWAIIILFLIPAAEVWGLSRITNVLDRFLFYLPNVLIAVVIGFIGLVFANLASDLVRHSVKTVGAKSANTLAALARYAIVFFTVLVVLNQLGVAQDLVRILFTGIVAMVAIAGGLAFGLGGQDLASDILKELKRSVK
ncbi:MAG: hypothetical protein ACE5DQ_01000 [Candidatus Paceibacterota bacterium]